MEKLHVQPSELDALPYYEYEYMVSIYNDILKERKEKEDQNYKSEADKYNIGNLNKQTKGLSGFKQPKMPKISLPKI